ncbi:hypothetical protein DFH07DRAFT_845030 [Mycena maculata]|uniref:Uncharacterized protein n=1 Tax=Mycena maculata TaxID=230809 RepID=A0AAD7I3H6_9AGAR|nr:hypothetical protein DFH07DRAFT_845030 [Mycena maculata]
MSASSGIQSLALRYRSSSASILPSLSRMKLRQLSLYLGDLFADMESIDQTLPLFSSITHLELFDWSRRISDDFPGFSWSSLAFLPALTHFAVGGRVAPALAVEIFAGRKNLAVFVGGVQARCDFAEVDRHTTTRQLHALGLLSDENARLVYILRPISDHAADWLAGAKEGRDFWARADAFVAMK